MSEYKKDHFWGSIGVILWAAGIPISFLFSIWGDGRWLATAAWCAFMGLIFISLSIAIDSQYRKRGIRK